MLADRSLAYLSSERGSTQQLTEAVQRPMVRHWTELGSLVEELGEEGVRDLRG